MLEGVKGTWKNPVQHSIMFSIVSKRDKKKVEEVAGRLINVCVMAKIKKHLQSKWFLYSHGLMWHWYIIAEKCPMSDQTELSQQVFDGLLWKLHRHSWFPDTNHICVFEWNVLTIGTGINVLLIWPSLCEVLAFLSSRTIKSSLTELLAWL